MTVCIYIYIYMLASSIEAVKGEKVANINNYTIPISVMNARTCTSISDNEIVFVTTN